MDQYPITRASLNLTRACNLRCDYCFTNGCNAGDMSFEVAKKAVDFLINNASNLEGTDRKIDISFWGGEPLLEWQLLQQIVHYAEEKGARDAVNVGFGGTTNGILLTPDKFDFLDKHKVFFMVSFDGTGETHDFHRKTLDGQGSHEIVESNLKEALKRWPDCKVRMSPFAERIDHFYEDCKYIFDLGCNYLMFRPVYGSKWTESHWTVWENECLKVIDYMATSKGRKIVIENGSNTCGAGKSYVGIDIDGSIYPCHRFNKFDDKRPWQEKGVCIGHIDHGITRPEFREEFINFHPQCGPCIFLKDSVCHGGCFAINYDFTGDITTPYIGLCRYTMMQEKISQYYKEKMGENKIPKSPLTIETLALLIGDLHHRVSVLENK